MDQTPHLLPTLETLIQEAQRWSPAGNHRSRNGLRRVFLKRPGIESSAKGTAFYRQARGATVASGTLIASLSLLPSPNWTSSSSRLLEMIWFPLASDLLLGLRLGAD